jgi:hypothetical protein
MTQPLARLIGLILLTLSTLGTAEVPPDPVERTRPADIIDVTTIPNSIPMSTSGACFAMATSPPARATRVAARST